MKMLTALAIVILTSTPSWAQSETQYLNAARDSARAQERQADSLRRMETIQRDQARRDDSARQNAERDSRSMRRFDR